MEAVTFLLIGVAVGGLGMWCLMASRPVVRRPRRYVKPANHPTHYLVALAQARSGIRSNEHLKTLLERRDEHLSPEQKRLKAKKFP